MVGGELRGIRSGVVRSVVVIVVVLLLLGREVDELLQALLVLSERDLLVVRQRWRLLFVVAGLLVVVGLRIPVAIFVRLLLVRSVVHMRGLDVVREG